MMTHQKAEIWVHLFLTLELEEDATMHVFNNFRELGSTGLFYFAHCLVF
jgi:hypothetical protein